MSKHRAEPPPRVRYGRVLVAAASMLVTAVALLGGVGIIPIRGDEPAPANLNQAAASSGKSSDPGTEITALGSPQTPTDAKTNTRQQTRTTKPPVAKNALPAGTGTGKRVVFSEGSQRVWLVNAQDKVVSTYLVSGSVTDNLHPGRYSVYSTSRWAVGIDDSGVMQYFVRFTRGNNAAIGFHSIPTRNGRMLQTFKQLGTPQSHGCIRQKLTDAERLWDFAPVGTRVVVL